MAQLQDDAETLRDMISLGRQVCFKQLKTYTRAVTVIEWGGLDDLVRLREELHPKYQNVGFDDLKYTFLRIERLLKAALTEIEILHPEQP